MMVEDVKIQRVKLPVETSNSSESRKAESVLSKCSCPECDSLKCFILRRNPANNLCNCPKNTKSCCDNSKKAIQETKPKLDMNRVISQVNRTVDICTKITYSKKNNSENGTVNTIIQSSISCKSIGRDSYKFQDSFSDVKLAKSPRNLNENTAHLSAQIIKAGCIQDFNDCISNNEPYKSSGPEINNVKEYIYTKLKEIYNACSCKVCECIPTTPLSTRKSTCSCKPCQCDDCRKLYNYVGSHLKEKPHVGCPCISCDRKDCQGVVKKWQQTCSCKPCDCLMCTESLSKNCNCAPCACFECKYKPSYLRRSYIVAAVSQSNRSTTCSCDSPCECSNCIPTYGTTALSQERSTGTVAHTICPCNSCTNQSCQSDGENCRCAMRKHVMSKPIDRGHHEYDIRNVSLGDTDIIKRNYNRDVISMCANVQQQFCMGDDPSQCIQRENRFAAEYIQLSLPNKICRHSNSLIPYQNKSSDNAYNTGDCLDDKELTSLGKIADVSQLHNAKASYCNCEFCKRQQLNYVNNHIGNIIQNKSLPNDTASSFKERPELLLIESKESSQNVSACEAVTSKQTNNNRIIEVNHFATDPNSKNSININNKLKRNNTELLLSQHKKLYCVASIIRNFALFSEGSSSVCNEGNSKHSSSLNMKLPAPLDPVTSTLLVVPENLNSLDAEQWSINNNYFKKSATLPFFNALYDENQRTREIEEPNFSIKLFDYANVQTTLLQAQEFSTKLRGLLESYEAANNDFRSVSQRLRKLYDEIVNSSTNDDKTHHRVHFKDNKKSNKLYYVSDRISLSNEADLFGNSYNASLITCLSSNSNKTILKPILGSHNLLENIEYVRSSCVLGDEDIFGDAISNCCTVPEVNSYLTINNGTVNACKRKRSPSDICKKITSVSRIMSNKYAETDFPCFHRAIMFSKSTCTQNAKTPQNENINTEITFRDADFYKDENTETNVIESLYTTFENIDLPSSPEVKNNENFLHWNVLRKNIFLESRPNLSHNSDEPSLEVNIKEIIRIISQEIRKELIQEENTMTSQTLHKSISFNHEENKASFSDIRRISDHTVLVKWNIPNNISNIKGYELLIDGRVVKKILSPHCAMAAISSLPQSERVLLSLLTITNSKGPYSSNTIVYNPRNIKR